MKILPERIMGYAEAKPEATPTQAEDLLHFGDRAAVSRALSRLVHSERLMRTYRRNLHAPDRDPIRPSGSESAQGTCFPVQTMG